MTKKTYDINVSADIYTVIKAKAQADERSIRIWTNRFLTELFAEDIKRNNTKDRPAPEVDPKLNALLDNWGED